MKKFLSALAILLCVATFATSMPAVWVPQSAYADEIDPAAVTPVPTEVPTPVPTEVPTAAPTEAPTAVPTEAPTAVPTEAPTVAPTAVPTEAPTEAPTAVPTEAPTEVPAENATVAPTEAPTETPAETPAPESSAEASVPAEVTPSPVIIDYTRSADHSPEFTCGFGLLLKNGVAVYESDEDDAEVFVTVDSGVVYVAERTDSGLDRLHIVFSPGPEADARDGWVDADCLRPMDPETETPVYIASCENEEGVIYFRDDPALPLRPLACTYPKVMMFAAARPAAAEPDSIFASCEEYELLQSQAIDLNTLVSIPEGTQTTFTYSQDDESIVSIDESGVLTAVNPGETGVIISTANDKFVSINFIVKPAVEIETLYIELIENETGRSVSAVDLLDGSAISYSSANEEIVTVDSVTGEITIVGCGETTIVATAENGYSAECAVSVYPVPVLLSMRAPVSVYKMCFGEVFDIKAALSITDGTGYTYKIEPESCANVSANGLITAKERADATVTATAPSGETYTLPVSIYYAPNVVYANPSRLTLSEGQTHQLQPSFVTDYYASCTYSSEKPEIVSIDEHTGMMTAESTGICRVCITTSNGKKAYATITVLPAPREIGVENSDIRLGIGEPDVYVKGVCLTPNAACTFTYASDSDCVAVDPNTGLLTAVREGSAKITVTSQNGLTAYANVSVLRAPVQGELKATISGHKMCFGEVFDIKSAISIPEDTYANFSYAIEPASCANISADGLITAKERADATVTVTAHSGASVDIPVSIYYVPNVVFANPEKLILGEGQTHQLQPSFVTDYYASCTFTSEKPEIVSIDEHTGMMTAESTGECRVWITTSNGKTAFADISVLPASMEICVEDDDIRIGVGEPDAYVKAICLTPDTTCTFTYASDSDCVEVDRNTGLLTAVREGSATITVTSDRGATATANVTVVRAPVQGELKATISGHKMCFGEVFDIKSVISIPEGTSAGFSYKIEPASCANIGADGLVTAKERADATITVTAHSGASVSFPISLYYTPNVVYARPAKQTLGVGQSYQLQPSFVTDYYAACTYSSEDPATVSIDENTGMMTAKATGFCRVWITTSNGKKASATITVVPAPKEIGVENDTCLLGVDEPGAYVKGVCLTPGAMCSFTYSSDSDCVAVDRNTGAITAVKEGSAKITATSHNGLTAFANVTVVKKPDSLDATCDEIRIGVNEVLNAKDFVKITEGSHTRYQFACENSTFASIDEAGNITGIKTGSTSISVTIHTGHSVTIPLTVCSAPTSVTIAPKAHTLAVGMGSLATAALSAGSASRLTYTSSDTDVVSVNAATGEFTAVSEGEAEITVETFNGLTDTMEVRVIRAPEADEIWITPTEFILGAGEKTSSVTAGHAENTLTVFSYSSSDPETVDVDPITGKLDAKKTGEAVITATSHNGKTADCAVTVMNAPTTLTLSHDNLTIMVGESNTDVKAHCNEGAACGTLTYSSGSKDIVDVVDNALVGIKPGTATITATTYNGISAECTVTVKPAPTSVSFTKKAVKLGAGDKIANPAVITEGSYSKLRFTVSDGNVLRYNAETNEIEAIKSGDATVTVTTYNGLSDVCSVSVYAAPTSIELPESLLLSVGMTTKLVPVFAPNTYGSVSFEITEGDCIELDDDGTLRAISEGIASVKATTYNGKSAVCAITVGAAPASVSYGDLDEITIAMGDTVKMPVPQAAYADNSPALASYTFSANASGVVSIDNASGEITGLASGSVTVTACSHNGLEDSIRVNVVSEISGLSISDTARTLYYNDSGYVETFQLECTAENVDTLSLVYSSSDRAVALVDESGLVTALAPGKATISVETFDGQKLECEVTVHKLSSTIAFSKSTIELGVGETYTLSPVFEEGCSARVSYSGGNNKISVDGNGVVKVRDFGEVTITATTQLGATASIRIIAIASPTAIRFDAAKLALVVGETVKYLPILEAESETFRDVVYYRSSDDTIVAVAADGTVTAKAEGTAVITAVTANELEASYTVEVLPEGSQTDTSFGTGEYSIVVGDKAEIPLVVDRDAVERGFTVTVDTKAITLNNGVITAGNTAGTAVITLSINPTEGETEAEIFSCTIHVVSAAAIELSAERIIMKRNAQESLSYEITPANLIGTFEITVGDEDLVSYNSETGTVTSAGSFGETDITFTLKNTSAACHIAVNETTYRALSIGEYNNSIHAAANLPFAQNNIDGVRSVVESSIINGSRYALTEHAANPSKGQIQSLISSTFADADENDVSLIYIVAHGHFNVNGSGIYGFSIPGYANIYSDSSLYVTSAELMSWLEGIEGNVVLVLTTCYSGGFIDNNISRLDAAGNISVVCSSHGNTNSSYFEHAQPKYNVDSFTYSLLYTLGFHEQEDTFHTVYADTDSDGLVTVQEAFHASAIETLKTINMIKGMSGFRNSPQQTVQYYIADGMQDLPIYSRSAE